VDESGSSHLVSVRLQDMQPAPSRAGEETQQVAPAARSARAAQTA
jgi:hypothetical protein